MRIVESPDTTWAPALTLITGPDTTDGRQEPARRWRVVLDVSARVPAESA